MKKLFLLIVVMLIALFSNAQWKILGLAHKDGGVDTYALFTLTDKHDFYELQFDLHDNVNHQKLEYSLVIKSTDKGETFTINGETKVAGSETIITLKQKPFPYDPNTIKKIELVNYIVKNFLDKDPLSRTK